MVVRRKMFWIILFACTFFALTSVSYSGSAYEVKCEDPKCAFETEAGIGGGIVFEEAAGFCTRCEKWVSITWKRGEKTPRPFVEFWDPKTGETRRLYKCPKCKRPFVVIERIEDMRFCPRCNKPTLENKRTVLYD